MTSAAFHFARSNARGACALAAVAAAALAGCQGHAKSTEQSAAPTSQPSYSSTYQREHEVDPRKEAVWREQPAPMPQASTPVAQGPTPLVYLYDAGGPVQVVDEDSKQIIASGTAAPRSIIRIDDRHGVSLGSDNVLPGPLPAGHRYTIVLEPTTPGVMRQGVGPPPTRQHHEVRQSETQ